MQDSLSEGGNTSAVVYTGTTVHKKKALPDHFYSSSTFSTLSLLFLEHNICMSWIFHHVIEVKYLRKLLNINSQMFICVKSFFNKAGGLNFHYYKKQVKKNRNLKHLCHGILSLSKQTTVCPHNILPLEHYITNQLWNISISQAFVPTRK